MFKELAREDTKKREETKRKAVILHVKNNRALVRANRNEKELHCKRQ